MQHAISWNARRRTVRGGAEGRPKKTSGTSWFHASQASRTEPRLWPRRVKAGYRLSSTRYRFRRNTKSTGCANVMLNRSCSRPYGAEGGNRCRDVSGAGDVKHAPRGAPWCGRGCRPRWRRRRRCRQRSVRPCTAAAPSGWPSTARARRRRQRCFGWTTSSPPPPARWRGSVGRRPCACPLDHRAAPVGVEEAHHERGRAVEPLAVLAAAPVARGRSRAKRPKRYTAPFRAPPSNQH